jgi:hypothetical protein
MEPFAVTSFPSIARILSLFRASPAFAGGAPDTGNWPIFDSRDGLPGIEPSFTLRYPPSFTVRTKAAPLRAAVIRELDLVSFSGEYRKSRRSVILNIGLGNWTAQAANSLWIAGPKEFWTGIGKNWCSCIDAQFESARPFKFEGLHAADVLISSTPAPELPIPDDESAYGVIRNIIAGKWVYVFSGMSMYHPDEAAPLGYTTLSNPLYLKFIKPMLKSITFAI